MIKIENVVTPSPEQWESIIMGTRNPKNSWAKSDTISCPGHNCDTCDLWRIDNSICDGNHLEGDFVIGPNDHKLMMSLASGGPVHAKYRRMIVVYLDITAPLYWWKEFDTYKIGTVANSCSTMHKIHEKEFTIDDFSCEHLISPADRYDIDCSVKIPHEAPYYPIDVLDLTIQALNLYRDKYLEAKTKPMKEESNRAEVMKTYWWQMIQLLPSSYNQKRTVMLNYEVLAGIYPMRKNHKLDEWHTFCDWIKTLPYSELITGEVELQV